MAGLQNKMFAIFMAAVLSTSLMSQLQPRFLELAALYAVREKPSKMYHWTTFVLSTIIVEIPFNFVTGTLFFLPWYYAIGFHRGYPDGADARGGYLWYIFMLFQLFFSTFGQALAAFAPNEQTAATLVTLLFSFVILFNGVLQPVSQLVPFWHWMYHLVSKPIPAAQTSANLVSSLRSHISSVVFCLLSCTMSRSSAPRPKSTSSSRRRVRHAKTMPVHSSIAHLAQSTIPMPPATASTVGTASQTNSCRPST